MHLTKSDFILADDCLAKLYFKKNGFPNGTENPYMDYLLTLEGFTLFINRAEERPAS